MCHICGNVFDKRNAHHIYACASKRSDVIDRQQIRLSQILSEIPNNIGKECVAKLYNDDEYSIVELSDFLNIPYSSCVFLLKAWDISIRNRSESCTKRKSDKFKDSCIETYGCCNPSQNSKIKDKKRTTFNKHYGKSNIFCVDGFRDRSHTIMIDKYGKGSVPNINGNINPYGMYTLTDEQRNDRKENQIVKTKEWWMSLSDIDKDKIITKRKETWKKNNNVLYGTSKLEIRFEYILKMFGVSYTWQKWINHRSYDFKLDNTNIIIEIQGNYWHANPSLYKEDSLISYPNNIKKYAVDVWKDDCIKKEIAESYGYKVYYLWEDFINASSDDQIYKLIMEWVCVYEDEVSKNASPNLE